MPSHACMLSDLSESVCNVWLQELHFTDTHLSFGFLELMSSHRYSRREKAFGYGDTNWDVTDPAIEYDVPLHISFHPDLYHLRDRMEGFELVEEFLAGEGVAFSKAALKSKGEGKGKGEDKGKGNGEGDGKGKFSCIPEAGGRRRSRSRSRRHVAT